MKKKKKAVVITAILAVCCIAAVLMAVQIHRVRVGAAVESAAAGDSFQEKPGKSKDSKGASSKEKKSDKKAKDKKESSKTENAEETADQTAADEQTANPAEAQGVGQAYSFDDLNQEMYTTAQVNYRIGPSTDFDKKGTLSRGTKVQVNGQCRETKWYRVTGLNEEPVYISDKYLSNQKPVEQPQAGAPGKAGNAGGQAGQGAQAAAQGDWVASLRTAQSAGQIIVVAASGNRATVSMHNKNADGSWTQILSTSGFIGRNGLGKTREGDMKTPVGVYGFTSAFGIRPNPGCSLGYTQVDGSYYWVDDPNSSHYNRMVSTNNTPVDWNSAEHITSVGQPYDYVLALNYNSSCTPGAGSAVFLHCSRGNATAGCIAVPENVMMQIMQNVRPGCNVIIDSTSGVYRY